MVVSRFAGHVVDKSVVDDRHCWSETGFEEVGQIDNGKSACRELARGATNQDAEVASKSPGKNLRKSPLFGFLEYTPRRDVLFFDLAEGSIQKEDCHG